MAAALDGIRILDLSSFIAGPYAATLLGEMGAEVIKVEPLAGDPSREMPGFLVWNRGKRSVALDLRCEKGQALVRRLAETADVVVESFRPSTVARLGLSYETLSSRNPRLVYCSISAFGSSGPRKEEAGYDPLVASVAGIYADQGGDSNPPVYVTLPIPSYGAALLAAYGIGAALYDRELRGKGQWLEVPLLNAAMAMQAGALLAGEGFNRVNSGNSLGGVAAYRLYQCADDWMFIGCGNQTFWQKFCLAIDRTDLLMDPRFENAPWNVLAENQKALAEIIAPIIRQKPRAEWLAFLTENDIPCAPVCRTEDFIDDAQVLANGMMVDVDDPRIGPTRQLGIPVRLLDAPGKIKGPAPTLGQHTEEILLELGLPKDHIIALAQAGIVRLADFPVRSKPAHPATGKPASWASPTPAAGQNGVKPAPMVRRNHALEGIKVVDFGNYIAGAYGPTLLSDLGAEVVKVEPLQGDAFRAMAAAFQGWNRGKKSLVVDLRKEEGREVVYRLIEKADVVLENYRRGVAEKLGVGYETLRRINPRLIYCALAGHGETGPRHDSPGFDPLIQARGGAMAAQGGIGHPPVFLRVAISDYAAAILSAFGISLALYARERTGQGQRIELSLTNSTMALQADRFLAYPGKPNGHLGGPALRGAGATFRTYESAEGWLFLLCPDAEAWPRLCRALGRPDLAVDPRFASSADRKAHNAVLIELLEGLFRQRTAPEWLSVLRAENVPCAAVLSKSELMADAHVLHNELIVTHEHPSLGPLQQVGLMIKLRETPGKLWGPAPELGQHTDAVLAQYGYSPDQIARLRQASVVA